MINFPQEIFYAYSVVQKNKKGKFRSSNTNLFKIKRSIFKALHNHAVYTYRH